MVLFNYATRELTAKIVYYGPGLCGKTTNLEYIHKNLPEKTRGRMLSLATQTDRTLFFDFLPMDLGTVKGMKTRMQLYTVPGQVFYDATRKLVLKGADGVVFIVDSQKELMESNLESWENLRQNLKENNLDINTIPLVIQFNKRDLPNVLPVKDLNRKINVVKAPHFEAIAITGIGVEETLKGIAKVVLQTLSKRYSREQQEEGLRGLQAVSQGDSSAETAGSSVLPNDVTLDLVALEEIRELPNAEELDSVPEEAISLEPVPESIEKSESLDTLEDIPELSAEHFVNEVSQPEEVTVAGAAVSSNPAGTSVLSSGSRLESERLENAGGEQPVGEETNTTTAQIRATVGTDVQDINVPIEIAVGKAGQEVKLQISIQLKIRFVREE